MVGKNFAVELWETEHSCLCAFHERPWKQETTAPFSLRLGTLWLWVVIIRYRSF